MAKKKKQSRNLGLLVLALVGLAIVGGLTYYAANLPKMPAKPSEPLVESVNQPDQTNHPSEPVKVLKPAYKDGELTFSETTQNSGTGEAREVFAVNAFLKETKFLPSGARAESVAVKNGLAEVTFTKEFETTYGTEDEQTLVNGILKTLGQFKEIEKVAFKVDGHALDTLGSIDLSEPQPVIR